MEENLPPVSSKLPFLIGVMILVVAGIIAVYLYTNPNLLSKTGLNLTKSNSQDTPSQSQSTSFAASKLITFRSASAGGTVSKISESEITITGSGETLTVPLKPNVQIALIKFIPNAASPSAQPQPQNTAGTINDIKTGSKVTVVMEAKGTETELKAATIIVLP